MMERTGRRTVPQIYIGDAHVGGFDDLVALERAGKLDPLLACRRKARPGPFGQTPARRSCRRVKLRVFLSFARTFQHGRPTERRSGRHGSAPAADAAPQPGIRDRAHLHQGPVAREPGRAAVVPAHRAAEVEVGLRTRSEQIGEDVYECVLTLTVTATVGDKTLFLVEASQAGMFTIRGIPADEMQPVLMIACPNVLFPYARETIADATMRAGFPPMHLAPINFEVLYQQQLAQMQQRFPRSRTDAAMAPRRRALQPRASPPPSSSRRPRRSRPSTARRSRRPRCCTTRRRRRRGRCSSTAATFRSRWS